MLAARLIRSRATEPADEFIWVKQLFAQQDFNGHQVGLVMLSDVYDQKPKTALQLLQRHADSSNWVVRDSFALSNRNSPPPPALGTNPSYPAQRPESYQYQEPSP